MICTAVVAVMGTVFLAGVSYGEANESKKSVRLIMTGSPVYSTS